MIKVVNIKTVNGERPEYDIYIGRRLNYPNATFKQSKWHNPYTIKNCGIDLSLELYEKRILETPELYNALHELEGKILGCWCKPNRCHGDILIKLIKMKNHGQNNKIRKRINST